jgi:hypothetical protein
MGICTYTLSKHTNDNDACFFNVETTLERRNDDVSSCASEEGVVSAQLKAVVMLQLSKMSII